MNDRKPRVKTFDTVTEVMLYTVDSYIDFVEEHYSTKTSHHIRESKRIAMIDPSTDPFTEFDESGLEMDVTICNEAYLLASHFAVIALYRVVETRSKLIARCYYGIHDMDKKLLGSMKSLPGAINKHLGVDVKTLSHFFDIDELRLVCNAVKHEDSRVTDELAKKYPAWEAGKRIGNLFPFYYQARILVAPFLTSFASALDVASPLDTTGND